MSALHGLGKVFVGIAFPAADGARRPKINFLALVYLELGIRIYNALRVNRAVALFHELHLVHSELLLLCIGELLCEGRKGFDVVSRVGIEGFDEPRKMNFLPATSSIFRIDPITDHDGAGVVVCGKGKLNEEKPRINVRVDFIIIPCP